MKRILLGVLISACHAGFGQEQPSGSDTVIVTLDHQELEDVVVIDQWEADHHMKKSADNHQLELQLKQLKGINLISRGSFAQEVMYRGQTDGRIQVKLNGMRIYSACTDKMDPSTSYVVANNLRTAEVSSACESHCGNGGLAGNLNLELKVPAFDAEKKVRWGVLQQYQTNTNGFNTAVNLEGNTRRLAWRINGAWQQNGNYAAGGGERIQYSQNQKQNWALNGVYRLASKQFLKLDFIYDLATDVGYPALPMDVSRARAVIAGLTYSSYNKLGPFARFDVKLYHNDIYHEMDDTQREDVFMHMDMPGWSRTSGLTIDAFDWRTGKHNISASAEYFLNSRRAEMTMYPNEATEPPMFMLTWPDARTHGLAFGIGDSWHFRDNMLNTTLRLDYENSSLTDGLGSDSLGLKQWEGMGYEIQNSTGFFLPKLRTALTHKLNSAHSITSAIGYGMRAPGTSELYSFYLFNANDGFDYLGNPDLRAEQLLTAEVGHKVSKKKWELSSTLFLQQYYDYIFGLSTDIDAMTYGANGVREYHNIPQATFWGVELEGHYFFTKKLVARAQAEYLRGFRPGEDLPLVPPLQGTLSGSYSFRSFNFLVQSRLAAEQNHFNTEYGDRYTPGYALLDLAVDYKLPFKKIKMSAEVAVNNLLDTYYRNHLNWGGIPSMGRNIILKLQISR